MSSIDIKFRKVRFDQSPYLFHFTFGTIKEAKEAMFSILSPKMLLSTSGVICFTASPMVFLETYSFKIMGHEMLYIAPKKNFLLSLQN